MYFAVRVINTVTGINIQEITMYQDRSVRCIVLPNTCFINYIEQPKDISIGFSRRYWL